VDRYPTAQVRQGESTFAVAAIGRLISWKRFIFRYRQQLTFAKTNLPGEVVKHSFHQRMVVILVLKSLTEDALQRDTKAECRTLHV
jgi:hypothetical protein